MSREVATLYLESFGLAVDVVENGAEAVAAVRRMHYDLVFMDIQMPVMDGLEAMRCIRQGETGDRRTPLVAWTASALPPDRARCAAAGADGVLPKPFQPLQLEAILHRFLGPSAPSL